MFSIVAPIDANRLEQFKQSKLVYDTFPQKKEFIMPTRSFPEVAQYLRDNLLDRDVRLIAYHTGEGFNPAKALNLGVRAAKYDNIIITSPEVKPITNVLEQFATFPGKNILAQVFDEDESGAQDVTLVCKIFRADTPAMYFLAMFQKSDIEKINGWDEEFMKGYAYEDNDFGDRWVRAGLEFEVVDEIKALHQYHPRSETIHGGMAKNLQHYHDNTDAGVVRCAKGLISDII
jgi:hypothetical protein